MSRPTTDGARSRVRGIIAVVAVVAVVAVLAAGFGVSLAIGDALGGVRLSFAHPVRDQQVGLALDAGCEDLGGSALLALGRSRHLQEQVDGRWHADPTADLGRIERQHFAIHEG